MLEIFSIQEQYFSFQMTDEQIVLLSTEIDAFVEALESFELEEIGKPRYKNNNSLIDLFTTLVL